MPSLCSTASNSHSFFKHSLWVGTILPFYDTKQGLCIRHAGHKAQENICLGKARSHELSKPLLGSTIFNLYLKEQPGAKLWLCRPGPHSPKVYEMRLSFEQKRPTVFSSVHLPSNMKITSEPRSLIAAQDPEASWQRK